MYLDKTLPIALGKDTTDNLSCIIIGLEGVEKFVKTSQLKKKVNSNVNNFKKGIQKSKSIY